MFCCNRSGLDELLLRGLRPLPASALAPALPCPQESGLCVTRCFLLQAPGDRSLSLSHSPTPSSALLLLQHAVR